MRKITRIVVHHSATRPQNNVDAQVIDKWHREIGFDEIGYHFVICRNGFIQQGRDLAKTGAHCRADGANRDSVGICLVGGVNIVNAPANNYTPAQMLSLSNLITALQSVFVEGLTVVGHRDLDNKKPHCPMFDVGEWWNKTQHLLDTSIAQSAEVLIT